MFVVSTGSVKICTIQKKNGHHCSKHYKRAQSKSYTPRCVSFNSFHLFVRWAGTAACRRVFICNVLFSRFFFFYLRNDSVETHPRLVSHRLVHQALTDERQNAQYQLSGILSWFVFKWLIGRGAAESSNFSWTCSYGKSYLASKVDVLHASNVVRMTDCLRHFLHIKVYI